MLVVSATLHAISERRTVVCAYRTVICAVRTAASAFHAVISACRTATSARSLLASSLVACGFVAVAAVLSQIRATYNGIMVSVAAVAAVRFVVSGVSEPPATTRARAAAACDRCATMHAGRQSPRHVGSIASSYCFGACASLPAP